MTSTYTALGQRLDTLRGQPIQVEAEVAADYSPSAVAIDFTRKAVKRVLATKGPLWLVGFEVGIAEGGVPGTWIILTLYIVDETHDRDPDHWAKLSDQLRQCDSVEGVVGVVMPKLNA